MGYLKSILLIITVSIIGNLFQPSIVQTNLVMLYILVVVLTAVKWGKWPSLVASVLSVLIFDIFFVTPYYTLKVNDPEFIIAFVTLFSVGIVTSTLALKSKQQAETAIKREAQTLLLYNLSKDIGNINEIELLLNKAAANVGKTFNAEAAIFIKDPELKMRSGSPDFPQGDNDHAALTRAFSGSKPSGWNTPFVPAASAHYIPLKTTGKAFGVLGVMFNNKKIPVKDQYNLLETYANQIAVAVEKSNLAEEAQQSKLLREAEKLHIAFLNSISHDMRTPLVSIYGSLGSLLQNEHMDKISERMLIETAYEETDRLNQLVGDLLDMARVDVGALHLNKKKEDIRDLIGTTLKQMEKSLENFKVIVNIPETVQEVEVDYLFIMKVLMNLIDNAAKYSIDKKEIEIKAAISENNLEINISDKGIGISDLDISHIFDKFYRVHRPQNYEGTGLGLSICKGIVEAHGGNISAHHREGGGTIMKITLPTIYD